MQMPALRLALALLCLSVVSTAWADPDVAAARKAADGVRGGLPAPTPAIRFAYRGDILIEDLWAGEVSMSARIAKLGSSWVWRVSETSFLDWQGGEVRETLMLHLGKDLGIVSGTYERSDRDGGLSLAISRTEPGFDLLRRVRKGEDWQAAEPVAMKAPAGAVGNMAALMLFLRGAKAAKGTSYALPWVPNPAFRSPQEYTGERPLRLTAEGPGTWQRGEKSFETSRWRLESGGVGWTLHLSRDRRELIAMTSTTGPVQIVPHGLGGERITADPSQPATTWKRAFLKFGFGYHMARRELLADAFHWERMYEHETKVRKRWPADKPVEAFKQAWIQAFVDGSKHRDVPSTRRLLAMTFATGKVRKQTDDEVVFWAHPNFGGGTQRTYYLQKRDGVWGIVRIDG